MQLCCEERGIAFGHRRVARLRSSVRRGLAPQARVRRPRQKVAGGTHKACEGMCAVHRVHMYMGKCWGAQAEAYALGIINARSYLGVCRGQLEGHNCIRKPADNGEHRLRTRGILLKLARGALQALQVAGELLRISQHSLLCLVWLGCRPHGMFAAAPWPRRSAH